MIKKIKFYNAEIPKLLLDTWMLKSVNFEDCIVTAEYENKSSSNNKEKIKLQILRSTVFLSIGSQKPFRQVVSEKLLEKINAK